MKKNMITTALLVVLPIFAFAQADKKVELDEIKVYSAYATPINQDKTASSVTVLTEKDFAQRNATYVSDVLKTVPGVAIGATGGRGAVTSAFVRGANSSQVAVIVDGVKLNPLDSNFDFGGLSLSNVEHIEVLRGEQSALYGSDAIGGVIYITTKNGLYKDKGFNVDFDFGSGSNKTTDGSVTISGHNNGFYYTLHGNSHKTRSISALSRDVFHYTSVTGTEFSTGGAVENDKFHSDKISTKFGYDDGNKGIEITASHNSQVSRFDETYQRNETDYDDRTRSRETMFKLGGYLGNDQELFKHKVSVSQVKTDVDTFSTNLIYGPTFNIVGFAPAHSTADGKRLNTNYQLDINFDREGAITQALSVLGDYQRSEYTSSNFIGDKDKKLTERAIATEYRLFHEDDHSFAVSGRYVDNSQIQNKWVGRVSAGFRISPNFRLHGSFGTALRNPTMIDYFGYFGSYLANPNLKPEQSKGGDLGVLIESNNKQHSLDLIYFARNVKNLIQSNTTYTQSINLDSAKIKGTEVIYNGKFTDTLNGFANYTYTNTKDNKGLQLARRPKHQANAGIHFQATDKFGIQAGLSYVGKRIDTYPHRTKMPSYTLVNLGADYQIHTNFNVYVNLNNVFNKKYESVLGYGQDGRNVYVGLKGSF